MKRKLLFCLMAVFVTLSLACGCAFITSDNANEEPNQIETAANGFWLDSGNYNTTFSGGSGSESDPYIITTPQQFAGMGYLLQNNNSTYQSSYFKLANDIDLSAHAWNPIGSQSISIKIKLDGDNHTISGLTLQFTQSQLNESEDNRGYLGIFRSLSENAVVQNLKIESGLLLNHNQTQSHIRYFGVVCGYAQNASFDNISIKFSSVENISPNEQTLYIGGIVGGCESSVFSNCRFDGSIVVQGGLGQNKAKKDAAFGGICGQSYRSVFENCTTKGLISYETASFARGVDIGGICGGASLSDFLHCSNSCELRSYSYSELGGIVGIASSLTFIEDCFNYGDIIAGKDGTAMFSNAGYVGGICGAVASYGSTIEIVTSANYGIISYWMKGPSDLSVCAGGILGGDGRGHIEGKVKISKCINYSPIILYQNSSYSLSNFSDVGGIAGWLKHYATIEYCINYGSIKSDASAKGMCIGGILGQGGRVISTTKYTIQADWKVNYCANYGKIDLKTTNSERPNGGIVGFANIDKMQSNYEQLIKCVPHEGYQATLYSYNYVGTLRQVSYNFFGGRIKLIVEKMPNGIFYRSTSYSNSGVDKFVKDTAKHMGYLDQNTYTFVYDYLSQKPNYTLSSFIYYSWSKSQYVLKSNILSVDYSIVYKQGENGEEKDISECDDTLQKLIKVRLSGSNNVTNSNYKGSKTFLFGSTNGEIAEIIMDTAKYNGNLDISTYFGQRLYSKGKIIYFLDSSSSVIVLKTVITDSGVDTQDIGVNWQLSGTTNNVKVVKSNDGWYDSHFVYDSREVAALRILKNTSGAQFDSAKVYYGQKMYLRIVPKAGYYISSIAGKTTNNLKGAILGWDYNYIADPNVILSKITYSVSLTYDCTAVSGVSQSGYVPMLNVLGVVIKNNLNYINTNLSTNEFHIFSEEDRNKYFGYNYKEEKDLTSESNTPIGYKYKLQVKYGSDYYDLTEFDFNKYQTINIQDIVDLLIEKGKLEDSSLTKYADEGGKKISFNYDTIELRFVQIAATFNVEVENLENSYYNPEKFEKVGASASTTRLFNSDDDSNIGKVETNENVSVTVIPRYGYDYKGTQVEGSWVKSATDWDKVPNIKFTAKDILDAYLKNLTSYEKKVEALRAVENGGKDATNILMAFYYDIQKYEINLADDSTAKSVKISYVDGARSDGLGEYLRQSDLTKSVEVYYYAPVEISVDVPTSSIFDGIYFNSENGKKYLLTNYSKYAFKNDSEMNLDTINLSIMAMSSSEGVSVSTIEPTKNTRGIYQISKPGHLVWMSRQSSDGKTFEGEFFEQTAHINLSGISFIPIGTGAAFKGSYDGQNHSIIGFGRKNDTESVFTKSSTNIGLFGRADGATFKNINMLDFNVSGSYQVGALVGFANNIKIENCHAVSGINGTGVFDCYYLSSELNSKSQEDIAGNTLANLNKKLQKLVEDTTLGYTYKLEDADEDQQFKYGSLGGLVGAATNSAFVLCTNRVEFKNADEATSAYYGGIAGNADETTTFEKCLNYGKMVVSGTNLIAGGANKANIKYSLGYDSKAKSYYLYGYDGQNHIENSTDNASSIYSRLDKSVWALIDGELTLYDLYWN